MMNIAIVEDDRRYRESLASVVAHAPGLEVVGSYGDAKAAVAAANKPGVNWDLVLMDIDMPEMNGIDGARLLKQILPNVRVVMLTVFEEPATILEAICAGADGYLLKRSSAKELLSQVKLIGEGGAPLTSGVARTVLGLLRQRGIPNPTHRPSMATLQLTPREQEVLGCLVKGRSYKQAAADLGIKLDTVRSHIKTLYRKLQVHNVAEAVTRAIREGLV